MRSRIILLAFCVLACVSAAGQSSQVKQSATVTELPLKTVIISQAGAESNAGFWSAITILRFSVHKCGSMNDVQRIIEVFREDEAVSSIKEGTVTGDNKEFVLTLNKPREKDWYLSRFRKAGLTHLRVNDGRVEEI